MGRGNEILCFLFRSDKNSGCYGNLKFPLTCIEKKWKLAFSVVRLGIFEFCFYIKVYCVVLHASGNFCKNHFIRFVAIAT